MEYRRIYIGIALACLFGVVAVIALKGLNLGNDFTGGSILERGIPGDQVSIEQVREALRAPEVVVLGVHDATIQRIEDGVQTGESVFLLRTGELTINEINRIDAALAAAFGDVDIRHHEVIGPTIGAELVRNSVWALALAGIGMLIYLSVRFEWRFGLAALISVLFTAAVVFGILALLGREINQWFIAAILTVIGYSINDTIVIFDRIRENLAVRQKESLVSLVNRSVRQVLPRSINTSVTTLFGVTALYMLGGVTLRDFSLTMMLGVIVGTLASIFLASSVWIELREPVDRISRRLAHEAALKEKLDTDAVDG